MKKNMKSVLLAGLLLFATLLTGSATARCAVTGPTKPEGSASATEQTREALEKFYMEYTRWMSARFDGVTAIPALPLDDATRRKVGKSTAETDGDPLIRAQDFNKRSLPTLTVTPIDGDWYAVACLDTYENRGVVIPVRTLLRQGQLAITDVTLP